MGGPEPIVAPDPLTGGKFLTAPFGDTASTTAHETIAQKGAPLSQHTEAAGPASTPATPVQDSPSPGGTPPTALANRPRLFEGLALFDASRLTYEAAVRASLGNFLPLITLYSLGRIDLGIYAAFAAFTAIYGRSEPYRSRWLSVATVAVTCILCIIAGSAVQLLGAPLWLMLAGAALVTVITLPMSFGMQWIPKGSIFFLFAFLACANYPVPEEGLGLVAIVAIASGLTSWCIVMSGKLLRLVPRIDARLRPLPHEPVRSLSSALAPDVLRLTAAALLGMTVAGVVAWSLNFATHQYWAMLTVAAIFSTPSAMVSFERTMHRLAGTLAGVGCAAALFGGNPPTLYVIIACALCQFIVEVIVSHHYGVALTFITPLAIGASNLNLTSDWETLFVDRSRETLIGAACAVAIIVAVRWRMLRRGELA